MDRDQDYPTEYVWTVTVRINGSSAHVHAERHSSDGQIADCAKVDLDHRRAARLARSIDKVIEQLWEYYDGGDPF